MAFGLYRRNKFVNRTNKIIAEEKEKSDNLLLNILPKETAEELKEKGKVAAKKFDSVSVLFADFEGFTKMSEDLDPSVIVTSIDYYFSKFDQIIGRYKVEKIKTIGDAYMCAAGLPYRSEDHAQNCVSVALAMLQVIKDVKEEPPEGVIPVDIRIGINSGPVVSGVVGTRKFAYDIWGDTVNVASRMESHSDINKVNISETTFQLVKNDFQTDYRGEFEVKNRGLMKMYFVR